MEDKARTTASPQKSGFFREGWRELERKLERRKLRSKAQQHGVERNAALGRLGQRAWQEKIDLSSFADLRDHLSQLQNRAEELEAAAKKLEQEKAALEARRQAESAKFDAQRKTAENKKQPVDSALHSARERQSNQDRNIKHLVARQTAVVAELASLEQRLAAPSGTTAAGQATQVSVDQTKHQHLLLEQTHVSAELATARESFSPLEAEVNRLTGESQRYADEIAKVEAERSSALSPIDADLHRVKSELSAASQQSSAVDRDRAERFTQLGLALYGSESKEPALADGIQQIAAMDRAGSAMEAALEVSLALTRAMPRGTMVKFWSTLIGIPILLIGICYGTYDGVRWWRERSQGSERLTVKVNPYLTHPLADHPTYILANQLAEARNEEEVARLLLEAFRAIHLGVYTADGKKILGGAERGDKDFYLYDFLWKTVAHGYASHTTINWENFGQVLGRDLLRLREPSPSFQLVFAQAVQARYEHARGAPNDPKSFLILLVDGLARQQLKPYTLLELRTRSHKDLYLNPVQSFLLMLDFFTRPPKGASPPRSHLLPSFPSLIETVYAAQDTAQGCESVQGDGEEGEWGEGGDFMREIIEGLSEAVKGELAEMVGAIAGAVTVAKDSIPALILLSGVTVDVHAEPERIHLPHGGENRVTFIAQVTIEAKDAPAEPIPCGPLQGTTVQPGRKGLKGVRVEWDFDPRWEQYYKWAPETSPTGRRATFTDESGQAKFVWVSRKQCKRQGDEKGDVFGPEQATAVNIVDPAFSAVFGGANPIMLILKTGPSLYQFIAPQCQGYCYNYLFWHEKKPKQPQYGGNPNTEGKTKR